MKLKSYLRDHAVGIIIPLFAALIFSATLIALKTALAVLILFWTLFILAGSSILLYDFLRKRGFYIKAEKILADLDKKYLLSELIDEPNFMEGKFLYDALWQTNKSMREKVSEAERKTIDFRDYIELWVHEVKTPLSGLSLVMKSDRSYIDEIENYIEQALFYSKINTAEKDYIVKRVNLKSTVNDVIKNNKDALIGHKIKVELTNLDQYIHSDAKWLRFIINQIILNSIKYRRKSPVIKIEVTKRGKNTTLSITDNGVGIKKSELKHIFEKGFTGTNGRNIKSSTGMGLYIAKKLAEDLGHELTIESEDKTYTKVNIVFGAHDFYETLQER